MYDFFDYLYSNEGSTLYGLLLYLYLIVGLIAIILFVIILVNAIKTKKKSAIITSIILLLITLQSLSFSFESIAILKSAKYFSKVFTGGFDINDEIKGNKIYNSNMKIAAALSLIPSHKGFLYLKLGNNYVQRDAHTGDTYYNKAYRYLKTYKSKQWFIPMANYYTYIGDFDKAIEIADIHKEYGMIAECYIMKNDYPKALEAINKSARPNYILRANIYQNLGKEDEALKDYKKALNSCKESAQCISRVTANYNDKDYTQHNWERVQKNRQNHILELQAASNKK